jgi:hypothetical protein
MPLKSTLFKSDAKLQACLIHDSAHIKPGAAGDHVAKIQIALTAVDSATIDDKEMSAKKYGLSTAGAVLAFKTVRRIINFGYQTQPDNIVGKMTIAALDTELLAEQDSPIVIIVQSLIEVLVLFFLTVPAIVSLIGASAVEYERHIQNLEEALAVTESKPGRIQLNFGIRIPRRRFPFPVPPFLQSLITTFQGNPPQDPATAAFQASLVLLILLALAITALLAQGSDTRTRTIVGELQKIQQITGQQSVKQASDTRDEVKENDRKMQECRDKKQNLLGQGGQCAELAKIYDALKADVLRKLTQYIANPVRFPNLLQAINQLLLDLAKAFADLKDCLGCEF